MNSTINRRDERQKSPAAAKPGRARQPLPPLGERVTFLIHRINARLAQAANPVFRRHDLDLYSSRILVALLERAEMTVGELVELMVLPQSTISHQLRRLESAGLIRRRRRANDNRSVSVTLTPHGAAVSAECNELSRAIYSVMVGRLSAHWLAELGKLLRQLFANLDDARIEDAIVAGSLGTPGPRGAAKRRTRLLRARG